MTATTPEWRDRLGPLRAMLESEWLPAWLPGRRWFQAKSRGVTRVELTDGAVLPLESGASVLWLVGDVWSGSEFVGRYQLPMRLSVESLPETEESAIVGRTEIAERHVQIDDALAIPEVSRTIVRLIGEASGFDSERGRYCGEPTAAFEELSSGRLDPIRLSRAEQSHSNVILGDRLLLKVFRGLSTGVNPDVELTRALTERTTFRNMPALAGSLGYAWVGDGNERFTHAAMLQQFVPSRGQGWEWMLTRLAELYDACLSGDSARRAAAERVTLDDVAILARRTAEMHRALASIGDDADFAPAPFELRDWRGVTEEIRRQAEVTSRSAAASGVPGAREVIERVDDWLARQDRTVDPARLGDKHRIHGDFHLGQTLRAEDDYYFLDFEGEPSKSIEDRRRKQTPLRDVAGMLRSFDYAAFAALDSARSRHSGADEELARVAREWSGRSRSLFVQAYAPRATGEPVLSADRVALLDRLLMEKALYELDYELNNRPTWASIPLRGLRDLLGD